MTVIFWSVAGARQRPPMKSRSYVWDFMPEPPRQRDVLLFACRVPADAEAMDDISRHRLSCG
jgi:hypothetical protein